MNNVNTLKLLKEVKLKDLFPHMPEEPQPNLEGSGLTKRDGHFYVVVDNQSRIAEVNETLPESSDKNHWIGNNLKKSRFEGIAWDKENGQFYVVVESRPNGISHQARLEVYDKEFTFIDDPWLPCQFQDESKGFEGITLMYGTDNDGEVKETYLLALCEGNKCLSGEEGRTAGGGRIKVLKRKKDGEKWEYETTLKLPEEVAFIDYSGIHVDEKGRLTVVSQASSMVWISQLGIKQGEDDPDCCDENAQPLASNRTGAKPDMWCVMPDGAFYTFPKSGDLGQTLYCNVEGAWLQADGQELVVVSDERKDYQPECCRYKDQSIHIFKIPR